MLAVAMLSLTAGGVWAGLALANARTEGRRLLPRPDLSTGLLGGLSTLLLARLLHRGQGDRAGQGREGGWQEGRHEGGGLLRRPDLSTGLLACVSS